MDNVIKKISEVFTTQVKELSEGVLEFIGSVESTKDRDGEVIKADGWDLVNYKKNPIILWCHDYSSPPVGKATAVKVSKGQLIFTVKFADAETYPFADTIYKLCKGGFLNATSVGFIPKEWETGKKENDPTRTYLKQELLELSIVPVPSNPDALRNAVDSGLITMKDFNALTKSVDFESELNKTQLQESFWQMMDTLAMCVSKTMCDGGDADKVSTMTTHGDSFYGGYGKWVKACKKAGMFETTGGQDTATPMLMSFRNHIEQKGLLNDIANAEIVDLTDKPISQASLKDELDYCLSMIKEVGLSPENKELAGKLVDEIKRLSGSDIPVEIKTPVVTIPTKEEEMKSFKEYLANKLDKLEV